MKIETLPVGAALAYAKKVMVKALRCQVKVGKAVMEFRGRNHKYGDKCPNIASYKLSGKRMCVRHAQAEALRLLLRTDAAPGQGEKK